MRRRLHELARPAPDAAVRAARAACADATQALDRLEQALQAIERHEQRVERSAPSILHPRHRARYRAQVRRNADERCALVDAATRQQGVVRALKQRLEACEAKRAARELPQRIERELVEEELRRRASLERYVPTENVRQTGLEKRTAR